MVSLFRWIVPVIGVGLVCVSLPSSAVPTAAAPKKTPVDYASVDQIFRANDCVDCHDDSRRAAAGLSLTTYESLMRGGRNGSVMKPGDSAHTMIVQVVTGQALPHMPPGGGSLKPEEIATLKQWVDEGANTSAYGQALTRYYTAKAASKWDDALGACGDIEKMKIAGVPTDEIAVKSRMPIYEAQKDEKDWTSAAAKAVDFKGANANFLNGLAWTIVDPQGWIKNRDLDVAMKAANGAVENSGRKSGAVLDTLAWVYFRKGDKAKAIEIENEAMKCRDAQGPTLDSLKESMKAFGG